MHLNHVGLVSSSREKSDRFFSGLLEMERIKSSPLSAELAEQLFGIGQDFELLHYGKGDLLVEVFVPSRSELAPHRMSHLCLEVADRSALLEKCAAMGVSVTEAPKGDSVVVFIKDYDGNLFEIKQQR
jgi:catechol 2,3-dioxygenase-like lactoylglutathione lyase family enzyme